MKKLYILLICTCFIGCNTGKEEVAERPNIVLIYADDLGYGDVGCYGAKNIKTPAIDKLAEEGLRFTDAHCAAATCTPSRYALLTGNYGFRSSAEVLPGDAPLLIDPDAGTLPSMLKKAGYRTGVVGKWHLGLGIGDIDWNKAIKPGPIEVGFDYSYIIPATGDRVPCVFVEGHHVAGLDKNDPISVSYGEPIGTDPIGTEHPELLKQSADLQHSETIVNGISRIGYMSGGQSARWKDEDFADILTGKAGSFIRDTKEQPFFLFFSLHDIHVPRVPHERFVESSGLGLRGDAIVQMDWCVAEIRKVLEQQGLSENTMIIFTSDNGPVLDDGYGDQAVERNGEHTPSGPFRGGKYSAYEAGTRVPTIVSWPRMVQAGVSDALVSQVDLYASLARLAGQGLGENDALDSFDHLDAWLGKSQEGRTYLLEEAYTMALREGPWKYIYPAEPDHTTWVEEVKKIESGLTVGDQLYNLMDDVGETRDLADQYPEKVKEMKARIETLKKGRSRPQ